MIHGRAADVGAKPLFLSAMTSGEASPSSRRDHGRWRNPLHLKGEPVSSSCQGHGRWRKPLRPRGARGFPLRAALRRVLAGSISPYRPSRREQALSLRQAASWACAASLWDDCVDKLDKARDLDPAGDGDPNVEDLRDEADKALHPPPVQPKREDKPHVP
jgi:hypothetical protein